MSVSNPSFASDPYWSECDKIESITGLGDWKPRFTVGSLVDFDNKSYILIKGAVEVPSTGYTYKVELREVVNGIQNIKLKLIAPKVSQNVISKLYISKRFKKSQSIDIVNIQFERDFNWGPKVVKCNL
jgi:hypothetical protein